VREGDGRTARKKRAEKEGGKKDVPREIQEPREYRLAEAGGKLPRTKAASARKKHRLHEDRKN